MSMKRTHKLLKYKRALKRVYASNFLMLSIAVIINAFGVTIFLSAV